MTKFTVKMELMSEDKQPKNSYRFKSVGDDRFLIESVYIRRDAFLNEVPPAKITVTVEA